MRASEMAARINKEIERHGDLEIVVTWEGTEAADCEIYRGSTIPDGELVLLIDADDSFYRERFER